MHKPRECEGQTHTDRDCSEEWKQDDATTTTTTEEPTHTRVQKEREAGMGTENGYTLCSVRESVAAQL